MDNLSSMSNEPVYNTYLSAFKDEELILKDSEPKYYADTIVTRAFDVSKQLGADASVAIHIWMFVIHNLYDAVGNCEMSVADPGPIDLAYSLWVGSDQKKGYNNGWLLYSMAEKASSYFKGDVQDASHEEADVNTKMMSWFRNARALTQNSTTCVPEGSAVLRNVVEQMVSLLTIPLIQLLIHYMHEENNNFISLYALSVVPLIAGCNPSAFAQLKTLLIDDTYDSANFETVMELIESSYNCLQITCEDVGTYYKDGLNLSRLRTRACDGDIQLAGYLPSSSTKEVSCSIIIIYLSAFI